MSTRIAFLLPNTWNAKRDWPAGPELFRRNTGSNFKCPPRPPTTRSQKTERFRGQLDGSPGHAWTKVRAINVTFDILRAKDNSYAI